MKNFFLFFLLFFVFLFFFCSKDSTNNNSTITISGTVTLDGQSDYSGVTVSLYKPVQLDTALVRINQNQRGLSEGKRGIFFDDKWI